MEMEIQGIAQQMQRAIKKNRITISGDVVANALERFGFKRDVAGSEFDNAVNAVVTAHNNMRGLFISGNVGCGKTHLMQTIARWNRSSVSRWVYVKDASRLTHLRNTPEFFYDNNIYLDDVGCEEKIKEYGNTIDVVGDFIQLYHQFGKGMLFATTNLSSAKLNERYDSRVVDRLLDMCVVYHMKGESKRERIILK
jgi:DNA replication protein DnaC